MPRIYSPGRSGLTTARSIDVYKRQGYNAVTTAFSRYAQIQWGMEGGGFANCLMVATVAAVASYIPVGWIATRFGRKKTILAGVALLALCFGAGALVTAYHPAINIMFALVGVAWAFINVNSYQMCIRDRKKRLFKVWSLI